MRPMISLWDDLSFALKGDITCSAVICANWQTVSLHYIGATVHVLNNLAMDVVLAQDPDVDFLGAFTAAEVDVEPLRVRKTI